MVRLAEHGRIPTDAKYMNPRISFDGLNWWISVCVEFPARRKSFKLNMSIAELYLNIILIELV